MKTIVFFLCLMSVVTAYAEQSVLPQEKGGLSSDFSKKFDRLFLSQEPFRYQDNCALLSSIRKIELNPKELELVRAKLKEFLSTEPKPRPYAPHSWQTGVASEHAFLRLSAVEVLGDIGNKEEIDFIRNLSKHKQGEHPSFQRVCEEAIDKIENR
jgi:hypothetical protein